MNPITIRDEIISKLTELSWLKQVTTKIDIVTEVTPIALVKFTWSSEEIVWNWQIVTNNKFYIKIYLNTKTSEKNENDWIKINYEVKNKFNSDRTLNWKVDFLYFEEVSIEQNDEKWLEKEIIFILNTTDKKTNYN